MLIPDGNVKDLVDIPDNIKKNLNTCGQWIDQVLAQALERQPIPVTDGQEAAVIPSTSGPLLARL